VLQAKANKILKLLDWQKSHPWPSTKNSRDHYFLHETRTNFPTRGATKVTPHQHCQTVEPFLMPVGSTHSNIFELGKFSMKSLHPEMQTLLLKFGCLRLRWIPDKRWTMHLDWKTCWIQQTHGYKGWDYELV